MWSNNHYTVYRVYRRTFSHEAIMLSVENFELLKIYMVIERDTRIRQNSIRTFTALEFCVSHGSSLHCYVRTMNVTYYHNTTRTLNTHSPVTDWRGKILDTNNLIGKWMRLRAIDVLISTL